jgi:hypothetical protein
MRQGIVLDLSDHCIETAAKREYRRLVDVAMALEGDDQDIEEKLTLLKEFLERTNFRQLRGERPDLAGGSPVQVSVRRFPSGRVGWIIVDDS